MQDMLVENQERKTTKNIREYIFYVNEKGDYSKKTKVIEREAAWAAASQFLLGRAREKKISVANNECTLLLGSD